MTDPEELKQTIQEHRNALGLSPQAVIFAKVIGKLHSLAFDIQVLRDFDPEGAKIAWQALDYVSQNKQADW